MKVFIAGPRAISILNKDIKERLNNIINNNFTILVGDANGIDKAIQKFCLELNYNSINIFASNGKARNNLGNWNIVNVDVPNSKKGFDFYVAKDLEMAKEADYGFMIWNGKSKGTLNNMINLSNLNKKVLVYFSPEKKFLTIRSLEDIKQVVDRCDLAVKDILCECLNKDIQLSLNI